MTIVGGVGQNRSISRIMLMCATPKFQAFIPSDRTGIGGSLVVCGTGAAGGGAGQVGEVVMFCQTRDMRECLLLFYCTVSLLATLLTCHGVI